MQLSRKSAIALIIAGVVAVVAGGVAWRLLAAPKHLSVAVAKDGIDATIMGAFAKALEGSKASLRLDVVPVADVLAAGHALATGKTDLAVVRPDLSEIGDALGVTPLRKSVLVILTPETKTISSIPNLAGKRLAMVTRAPGDRTIVDRLLLRYDLTGKVRISDVSGAEAGKLLAGKQVDAVAMMTPPVGQVARRMMREVVGRDAAGLTLLDIEEAETLAEVAPAYSEETVKVGAFHARPQLPAEDLTTVGVSYYLMAQRGVGRETIATLTEQLFKERQKIARVAPVIHQMKGLDADEAPKSPIPTHQGAIDYFAREQRSFIDIYGDWLWIGLFATGGVSSAVTWIWGVYERKRRNVIHDLFERLAVMLQQARHADLDDLEALELKLDEVIRRVIQNIAEEGVHAHTMAALRLAIDSTRAAISERLALLRR